MLSVALRSSCGLNDWILYGQPHGQDRAFRRIAPTLTELLDALEDKHEHVLITRNGPASAMILLPDEYEPLEETLDILQVKEMMDALRRTT